MKVQQITEYPRSDVTLPDASHVRMRLLIGPADQADVFHMRHFEVAPGGHTPHHAHDYEHEILVLKGHGAAAGPQGDRPLKPRDVVWIPPNEKHQIRNTGTEPLEIICLIPAPKDSTK